MTVRVLAYIQPLAGRPYTGTSRPLPVRCSLAGIEPSSIASTKCPPSRVSGNQIPRHCSPYCRPYAAPSGRRTTRTAGLHWRQTRTPKKCASPLCCTIWPEILVGCFRAQAAAPMRAAQTAQPGLRSAAIQAEVSWVSPSSTSRWPSAASGTCRNCCGNSSTMKIRKLRVRNVTGCAAFARHSAKGWTDPPSRRLEGNCRTRPSHSRALAHRWASSRDESAISRSSWVDPVEQQFRRLMATKPRQEPGPPQQRPPPAGKPFKTGFIGIPGTGWSAHDPSTPPRDSRFSQRSSNCSNSSSIAARAGPLRPGPRPGRGDRSQDPPRRPAADFCSGLQTCDTFGQRFQLPAVPSTMACCPAPAQCRLRGGRWLPSRGRRFGWRAADWLTHQVAADKLPPASFTLGDYRLGDHVVERPGRG